MSTRQTTWPRRWLITDERLGDRLWEAIDRLPDGDAGIVFRHYKVATNDRVVLAREIAAICRQRGITMGVAGNEALARAVDADFVHRPDKATNLPLSMAVHTLDQAHEAVRQGAALAFISPVFSTRSHLGQPALGPAAAEMLAKASGTQAIALGGMDAAKFESLTPGAFHGWAAIDAWLSQSRD